MLLSHQHAGFGDLKLRFKIMSPKTVDHTFVRDLTMLIRKADSNTMANMTAPIGQAPTMAPPVHTNHQILPRIRWVQIGYLKFSAKGTKREVFGIPIPGIKRELSNARTPQQNGVAERKNRTLIEAARTVLADSLLPIPFWAKAVNTACYVQNKSTDDSENTNSTNSFNTASPTVNTASDKDETFQRTYGEWNFSTPILVNAAGSSFSHLAALDDFSKMPNLEETKIFDDAYDDRDEGAKADYNNLEITLVDLTHGKRAIGTKWVYRNKRDQRGIVVRNKARLVAQGHRQEEGIEYDEVFALVARIKSIGLFLAYASFMDFTMYQMDVKNKVYKMEKALYGLHQAPRAWTEFKNYEMNQFCEIKGIKREFSNARIPQQNGVTERKNKTLTEAVRTMLADSLLPIPFWAEAVNTACYVQNRLVQEIELMVMQVQRFILIQDKKEKRNSYVPSSHEEVVSSPKDDAGKKSIVEPTCVEESKSVDLESLDQQMKSKDDSENTNSTNSFNIASPTVNTASDKDGTF
nr:retrovirus-related Pol polyprotein from transposon TNT 1-94 [Tanacetum cinerariifolium]